MKKRWLKLIAACMALAVTLTDIGTGTAYADSAAVYAAEAENAISLEDAESNEVTFGEAEDWDSWDNMLKAFFAGDSKSIAEGSVLSYTMTIDEAAYQTLGTDDYIKLEAVFFQAENDWTTVSQLGYPMYRQADFQKNADETYSAEGEMTFGAEGCGSSLDVFQSLLLRGVGTKFTGKVAFSNVSLKRTESTEGDTLVLGDAESNEVTFGAAEDWDNTLMASFEGDNKPIAARSVLSFTMTMSDASWGGYGGRRLY